MRNRANEKDQFKSNSQLESQQGKFNEETSNSSNGTEPIPTRKKMPKQRV